MKRFGSFLLALVVGLLLARFTARAQSVGIGTLAPDAKAALDIRASDKGLLIPRLTAGQRAAIASPPQGLMVYQTDGTAGGGPDTGFWYFGGSPAAWVFINPAGGGADNLGNGIATTAVNLQGNALVGTGASIGGVGVGVRADGGLNLGQNGAGNNVLLGYQAGAATTATGTGNLFIGYQAGQRNSTGSANQFSGYQSGYRNTTGSLNQFGGYQSGYANTTGIYNYFSGYRSGYTNATGSYNQFSGFGSGFSNTTGSYNQFSGYYSGFANTTGNENTFSGYLSGINNTTGSGNHFAGYQAGYSNTTASNNLFIGYQAGYTTTADGDNQFVGNGAGYANTTGGFNHFDGVGSGQNNTTGSFNVFVGPLSGSLNATGSNNTALGSSSGALSGALRNTTVLGAGALVSVSNKIRLGNTAVTVIEGQVGFSSPSDARFKYDVRPAVPGLAFIARLRPVTYRFDTAKLARFEATGALPAGGPPDPAAPVQSGFLAQDVEAAARSLGYAFDGVHAPATARDHYSLAYAQFVVPLVRAVQELSQQVETLRADHAADHAALLGLQAQLVRLRGEAAPAQGAEARK